MWLLSYNDPVIREPRRWALAACTVNAARMEALQMCRLYAVDESCQPKLVYEVPLEVSDVS